MVVAPLIVNCKRLKVTTMVPYDKMIKQESREEKNPFDVKRKMSNGDKMLTAGWFRRMADAIKEQIYTDDMTDYVNSVVNRCKSRARELEQEVYKERVMGG